MFTRSARTFAETPLASIAERNPVPNLPVGSISTAMSFALHPATSSWRRGARFGRSGWPKYLKRLRTAGDVSYNIRKLDTRVDGEARPAGILKVCRRCAERKSEFSALETLDHFFRDSCNFLDFASTPEA